MCRPKSIFVPSFSAILSASGLHALAAFRISILYLSRFCRSSTISTPWLWLSLLLSVR